MRWWLQNQWWIRNALLTWVAMNAVCGILAILLDATVMYLLGRDFTISWQTRAASIENRVIPAAVGFLVWGLAFHFWRLYEMRPWDYQPIHDWFMGGVIGALFVSLFWLQRP